MKTSLLFLCMMLIFLVTTTIPVHSLALAETANWSEVATFTGEGSMEIQNTTYFTISHPEWRIRWTISIDPQYVLAAGFFVYVYRQGETQNYVGYIYSIGGSPNNGTAIADNLTGSFYMSVRAGSPAILKYTLIVEQDLNSVLEFPQSTFLPWALTTAVLVTIALAYHKQRSKKFELGSKTN
jgi:hypothetical protein